MNPCPRPEDSAGRGQAGAATHYVATPEALGSDAAGRWRDPSQGGSTAAGAFA